MELPVSFLENMKKLLSPEEFNAYLDSYSEERVYGLRVNTNKLTPEEFEKICPFEIKKIPWIDNGYYYSGKDKPAKDPYYYAGLYYLQEPSAMTPAHVLPIEPGDRVLDICAAPGGKSTELAAKLKGKGVLVSNDISNSRAKALLKNLELFGISNAYVISEAPYKLAEHFEGYFDKILIDAPCSGEGMFRKEPSVMKSWVEHGNDYFVKLQQEITSYALKMLRPGGMLLYSTCTFSPLEDEQIVSRMLKEDPDLELVEPEWYEGFDHGHPEWSDNNQELTKCVRIWPHRMKGEGHFLALLKKKGESSRLKESQTVYESFADMMSPEDAKRYLDFLENGSREGLTSAELAGVEKADALLVSRKVEYEDVWDLRNAGDLLESGLDSVDDIFTAGKKTFDNFDINNAYVKPKHLSTTGGNGQKFIGASKAETESILKDALSNGKIVSISDNGLTKVGNASYEIVIDAGKIVGTKGENLVKIVISSDGGMLSAYPIK